MSYANRGHCKNWFTVNHLGRLGMRYRRLYYKPRDESLVFSFWP